VKFIPMESGPTPADMISALLFGRFCESKHNLAVWPLYACFWLRTFYACFLEHGKPVEYSANLPRLVRGATAKNMSLRIRSWKGLTPCWKFVQFEV